MIKVTPLIHSDRNDEWFLGTAEAGRGGVKITKGTRKLLGEIDMLMLDCGCSFMGGYTYIYIKIIKLYIVECVSIIPQ